VEDIEEFHLNIKYGILTFLAIGVVNQPRTRSNIHNFQINCIYGLSKIKHKNLPCVLKSSAEYLYRRIFIYSKVAKIYLRLKILSDHP